MRFKCNYVTVLRILERMLLAFPISVVLLASSSFFFGGVCSLWQWCLAIALTLTLPWASRSAKPDGICATVLFLLLYIGLHLVMAMTLDWPSGDHLNYHLPVIRFLCEGWNPVFDADLSQITGKFGLMKVDPGMGYLHVAFTARTIAIFNAVAYKALRNPLSLTYPLVYFLSVSLIVRSFISFNGKRLAPIAAFFLLCVCHFIDFGRHVDGSAMLASAGLLLVIFRNLRKGDIDVIPMIAYTFWMACLKIPCAVAAVVFWTVFLVVCIWRSKCDARRSVLVKFVAMGICVVAMFSIASFNPYGTSWRDYGHPLYPFKTVDAEKFPVHDITGDFKIGNDDYKKMGWCGLWMNAFVSPKLVQKYYCRKFGQTEFKPHSWPWGDCQDPYEGVDTPVGNGRRATIWVAIAVLLLVPCARPLALMLFLSLFVLPKQHIGYLRYMPWVDAFRALALSLALMWAVERFRCAKWMACAGVLGLLLLSFVGHLPLKADVITEKYGELCERPREVFIKKEFTGVNNAALLMHQLGHPEVKVALADEDARKSMRESPFGYFVPGVASYVIPGRERSGSFSRYVGYVKSLVEDPRYVLRAFFVLR